MLLEATQIPTVALRRCTRHSRLPTKRLRARRRLSDNDLMRMSTKARGVALLLLFFSLLALASAATPFYLYTGLVHSTEQLDAYLVWKPEASLEWWFPTGEPVVRHWMEDHPGAPLPWWAEPDKLNVITWGSPEITTSMGYWWIRLYDWGLQLLPYLWLVVLVTGGVILFRSLRRFRPNQAKSS
jgi:hypothetical protein